MSIKTMFDNIDFTFEGLFVITLVDGETGECTDVFKSWEDNNIPTEFMENEIQYATIVNGKCYGISEPVFCVEI